MFFGIGTGQQVVTPLDNAQLSDKAFLMEGRLGVGTHLSKVFDLGISVPVSNYFVYAGTEETRVYSMPYVGGYGALGLSLQIL